MSHSETLRQRFPEVDLSPIEQALLVYLLENPRVVPREELLREVWGYHPNTKTRTVQTTVARLRTKIEADPKVPTILLNFRGRGYQLAQAEAHTPSPSALWSSDAPVAHAHTNLADPGDRFIGRVADLDALARLFEDHRLVTLHGTAGLGKTRLAKQYGLQALDSLTGGVWFCDLSSCYTATEALDTVASGLGLIRSPSEGNLLETLGRSLAARGPALLVLDNFEQLPDEATLGVRALLRAAPELRVLVTSRQRLSLAEETLYAPKPLDVDEAVSLLTARIQQLRRSHQPLDPDPLRAIATLLEGLPLALEMAAARARILPLAELASRLSSSFAVLKLDRTGIPDRQQTLRQAIDWSWQLLSTAQQHALVQLCVFRGGAPMHLAEAVLNVEDDPLDVLAALVDRSMVRVVSSPTGARLHLFEAVREFARDQGDVGLLGARDRHASWAVTFARHHRSRVHRERASAEQLAVETDNLIEAYQWLLARRSADALEVADALALVFRSRGAPSNLVELLQHARARLQPTGEVAAHLHRLLATALVFQGAFERARAELERGAERALPDGVEAAHLLSMESRLQLHLGHAKTARDLAARALDRFQALGLDDELGAAYNEVGSAEQFLSRRDQAIAAYRRGIEAAQDTGQTGIEATLWSNLGGCYSLFGELDRAIECLRRAERLSLEHDDPATLHSIRGNLATTLARSGDISGADKLFQVLLADDARLGGRTVRSATKANAGINAVLAGEDLRAAAILEEVAEDTRARGVTGEVVLLTQAYLLIALCRLGQVERAEQVAAPLSDRLATLTHRSQQQEVRLALAHLELLHARLARSSDATDRFEHHLARAASTLHRARDQATGDAHLAVTLLEQALRDTEAET